MPSSYIAYPEAVVLRSADAEGPSTSPLQLPSPSASFRVQNPLPSLQIQRCTGAFEYVTLTTELVESGIHENDG